MFIIIHKNLNLFFKIQICFMKTSHFHYKCYDSKNLD